jgi:isoleucyl-tRNA synthetase
VLPFITEAMYQDLVVARRAEPGTGHRSIHHEDYPEARETLIDAGLEAEMAAVRAVVGLARGLRVTEGLRIRQPLSTLTVVSHDAAVRRAVEAHRDLITDELNVKEVVTSADEASMAELSARPNYRTLGPRFGARMKEAAEAIESLKPSAIQAILDGGSAEILGEALGPNDLVVVREARPGVAVATGDRLSVALDTTITPELQREAMAREIVKLVQTLRKDAGLDVSDRIALSWQSGSEAVAAAFSSHGDWIAGEVLAVAVTRADGGTGLDAAGEPVTLKVEKA